MAFDFWKINSSSCDLNFGPFITWEREMNPFTVEVNQVLISQFFFFRFKKKKKNYKMQLL